MPRRTTAAAIFLRCCGSFGSGITDLLFGEPKGAHGVLGAHVAVIVPWDIGIINAGEVLASGRPDEIVRNEQVRQVYLGEHFRL